ncbi:hypothetical protein [Azospirillum sp. SYSU D00513]|uniref:hypothetical protein n=1 Tax=Azospirillum sp. SYSU D00513 TaxID=2812561 RepID=UPI001A9684AB|nr:hypothetical protein [Azospirillum sp. SYSU D00513]
MRLQTDPSRFSITAFLSDQVTLVARHEDLSPGAALLKLQELSRDGIGRARLMEIIRQAGEREKDPAELSKIEAIQTEIAAWTSYAA